MKNMSIGRKLGAAFAFLFALMLVVGFTGFRSLVSTAELARGLILVEAPLTEESRDAEARTLGLRRFEKDLFLNIGSPDKEAEYLAKWNEQLAKLQERLDTMERLARSDEDRSIVKAMRRDALTYRDGLHRVAAQMRDGSVKTPQQANAAIASVKDPIRTLGDGAAAFADTRSEALKAREKDVDSQVRASATRMLILLLVAAGVSLVVAVVMIRGLTRDIGAAVHHVQSSSTQLQAAANQQATASKEQAAATNETTTTIRELVATARQIAESAQRVAQIAQQTAAGAENGEQTIRKAQDGLGTIKRQVDVIVGHMLELGRKSQQIGGILDIINELAEQTNILSINATIEAAGAGEAGKRFSVVADEIRKLADRVGGSTKDIRTLIEEIRTAVNTTVMATEQGTKAVEQGSRQVGDVATAFTQIATLVETTTEAAREIELSTKQQTTAVEQVSIAMGNVVLAAKESEASSSETLQTAVQLNTLSRDLTRLIRAQA